MDLEGAALPPPLGMKSDFVDPPNKNGLALFVFIICSVVSTVCVLLRAYGRVYLLKKVQIEEILVFLAFGCYWGSAWACFKLVETPGFFVNQWNVKNKDLIPMTYYVYVFGVFYSFVLPFVKISILVEWCRMFVHPGTRMRNPFWWGCMSIIFVQVTANIAIIIALNLQCTPHKGIWDFTVERKCFDLPPLQISSASIHLACDIVILLLPQRIIWTLNMSVKKRLGVSFVFGLGLLACVSAATRLASTVAYTQSTDPTYDLGPLIFWATAEMACGFFIVCVPCIPKILQDTGVLRNMKRALGMTTKTTQRQTDHYGDRYAVGTTHTKTATTVSNAYYKLDEEGVPMKDLGHDGSSSTEQLNNNSPSPAEGITRTTQITVTKHEEGEIAPPMPPRGAWR